LHEHAIAGAQSIGTRDHVIDAAIIAIAHIADGNSDATAVWEDQYSPIGRLAAAPRVKQGLI
jgi:hypothetical protein